MTRNNEPSYRKKGLSVFLTVLMILSVVAMSATFVGTVAAQNVDDDIEPDDIGVGVEEASQDIADEVTISDLGDDEASVMVDISALNESGIDLDELDTDDIDVNHDTTLEGVDGEQGVINLSLDGDSEEADLTLSFDEALDTQDIDPAEDLYYTLYVIEEDDGEAGASFDDYSVEEFQEEAADEGAVVDTETFDLVEGATLDEIDIDTDVTDDVLRTVLDDWDDSDDYTVVDEDITITVDVPAGVEDQTVTLDLSDLNSTVDLEEPTVSDWDSLHDGDATWNEDDEELTLEFNAEDGHTSGVQSHDISVNIEYDAGGEDADISGDNVFQYAVEDEFGNSDSSDFRAIEVGTIELAEGDTHGLSEMDGKAAHHDDVWQGEILTIEVEDPRDTITIYEATFDGDDLELNDSVTTIGTTPGAAANYDTSDLDGDQTYAVQVGDEYHAIELQALNLDIEADDVDDDEDLIANVTSDDLTGSDITVDLIDADDEVEDTVETDLDSNGERQVNFGVQDAGDYTVEVTHDDSEVTAEDDVTVGEAPEPETEVSFGDLTDAAEGDYAEIEFEFNDVEDYDDDAIIFWINESDYNLNATLNLGNFANDSVTMTWNTEQAGQDDAGMFDFVEDSENLSVTINDETEIDTDYRLNPGGYDLSVFDDGTGDNVQDTDSLTISERSTGDVSAHIAPADADDYDDNLDWILENSTASDTVANGDVLILEQEVNGIFGHLDQGILHNENISDVFPDPNGNAINGTFTPSEAPAYTDPVTFQHDADNVSVYANSSEGVLYFVYDVEVDGLDEGDTQEWEFDFNITGEAFPYLDDDDDESASMTYTVTDRSVTLDKVEAPYQVTPTENGTITGTSTLAPGSNITINVAKSGVFSTTDSNTQVDSDGTWTFVHDFSDRSVGEEFTITISAHDVDEESYEASFNDTAEADTVSDVDQLEQQISELEDEISDLESEIADLESQLADAEGDVSDLEQQLADAESDLADAEAERDGALEDLSDAEDTISDLEGDLSDANDEIEQLESDLADAEADDDDDEQPAFGPIAALFALLAGGALIARRRL